MAQLIWAEQCRQRGAGMVVSSAGLDARPGQGPDAMCVALLAERGLDLAGHRARRLDFARIADLDLILVMENIHAQRLCSTMPLLQGRVHLLGRWGAGEIIDPRKYL